MSEGQDDRNLHDLTAQMSGWKSGTGADLLIDDPHVTQFLGKIDEAKEVLQPQLKGANGLQAWLSGANVGTFVSATTTRGHLHEDINEFIDAINRYDQYLDALRQTTDAARASFRKADQHPS
jgi:hypothetical protein